MSSGKLWAGRTDGITDTLADDFNSSIGVDSRMYRQDIQGSIAHAKMLGKTGILAQSDVEALVKGLSEILSDMDNGTLKIDMSCEDIHMFVESELTKRLGDVGKKLHTARSRNDQVALDFRMYLRDETDTLTEKVTSLAVTLLEQAEAHYDTIMVGYTHLQRAQPITFGQHLLAYVNMLLRDRERLKDGRKRINRSPIGSCALAGTTYPTDREYEAKLLNFDDVCENSMDGVSDRDFALEFLSDLSILMMHLSRLSEELLLWTSWEFRYVTLSDAYTTGSSIMPQKKNSDMAELIRGKTGRVYGDLMGLLTTMKGIPLAYNKDMQEDKEGVFDAIDTVKMCLDVMKGMISTMSVHKDNMLKAGQEGFINATDLADYLVSKGIPFRDAYKISGSLVARCIADGVTLETLPLETYKGCSPLIDADVYTAVDLKNCVYKRNSLGGTSPDAVIQQIKKIKNKI